MVRVLAVLLTAILGFSHLAVAADNWQAAKSTHFIVYYKEAPESFIERITNKAEDYYTEITDDLGFTRFDFWLWDKRAKIYIYDNAQDYQASTRQPDWSQGAVIPKEKIIYSFPEASEFFEVTLPHEMAHIIFREIVGFDNYAVPAWLDEGVASYRMSRNSRLADNLLRQAIEEGSFMGIEQLSGFNPVVSSDKKTIDLFYAAAASIIHYLFEEFGQDDFVYFCQALRDKKNLDNALSASYPFNNAAELGRAWQKYLKNE